MEITKVKDVCREEGPIFYQRECVIKFSDGLIRMFHVKETETDSEEDEEERKTSYFLTNEKNEEQNMNEFIKKLKTFNCWSIDLTDVDDFDFILDGFDTGTTVKFTKCGFCEKVKELKKMFQCSKCKELLCNSEPCKESSLYCKYCYWEAEY